MERIGVMVNGVPGNMAVNVARHVLLDERFHLVPYSLTGPEINEERYMVDSVGLGLIRPDHREDRIVEIRKAHGPFLCVDYTHPSGVNANADFYCRHGLAFVMGTTGGQRSLLESTVCASSISAVIAPNMAKQIVGFQAMMEYAAKTFPGLFKGYTLEIRESHQKGKADTSGTARAMVGYFNELGIPFSEKEIVMVRDPEVQKNQWGVPEAYLSGHGWHVYRMVSADGTVTFELRHTVNGREIYVEGTLDAVCYLHRKIAEGSRGEVYSMIDVLSPIFSTTS